MSGKKLAIVTPVFNRSGELPALYASLVRQERQDFKWYVVDDGSNDVSWDVIEDMRADTPFPMETFHKENGGKHTAVNLAMRHVMEPLTFIVDSDDTLPVGSVATILDSFDAIRDNSGLCGISFLKRSCVVVMWMYASIAASQAIRPRCSTPVASRSSRFRSLLVNVFTMRTVFGCVSPLSTRCFTRTKLSTRGVTWKVA